MENWMDYSLKSLVLLVPNPDKDTKKTTDLLQLREKEKRREKKLQENANWIEKRIERMMYSRKDWFLGCKDDGSTFKKKSV